MSTYPDKFDSWAALTGCSPVQDTEMWGTAGVTNDVLVSSCLELFFR